MRNTYKYTKLYSGGEPEFIEGDVFKTIIPLNDVATGVVGPSEKPAFNDEKNGLEIEKSVFTDQDSDQDVNKKILVFCKTAKSKKEICDMCGFKNLTYFTRKHITPLVESGLLKQTIPEKPTSKNQKYITAWE